MDHCLLRILPFATGLESEDDPAKYPKATEIKRRWTATINMRITTDRAMTNQKKHGHRAIPKHTVLRTWSGVLHEEYLLPEDWINYNGFLVGIGPPDPPRQHAVAGREQPP